jgi:hypothetical protein
MASTPTIDEVERKYREVLERHDQIQQRLNEAAELLKRALELLVQFDDPGTIPRVDLTVAVELIERADGLNGEAQH